MKKIVFIILFPLFSSAYQFTPFKCVIDPNNGTVTIETTVKVESGSTQRLSATVGKENWDKPFKQRQLCADLIEKINTFEKTENYDEDCAMPSTEIYQYKYFFFKTNNGDSIRLYTTYPVISELITYTGRYNPGCDW